MANNFTPLQGYFAGIFRSPGVTVSSSTVHELVQNNDFETGDLTNWTSNCTGTGATGDIARVTARKGYKETSYGMQLIERGMSSNTCQVTGSRYMDTALGTTNAGNYDCILSAWYKPANTGQTGKLKLCILDPTGSVLSSGSVEISDHTAYSDGEWAYRSVRLDTNKRMSGAEWRIESDMVSGSTGTWYFDDVSCVIVEQCAGAYNNISIDGNEWDTEDVTTFASTDSDGPFRRIHPTMMADGTVNVESFYVHSDSPASDMAEEEKVFVSLSTKSATKTADRWEFWAWPLSVSWSTAFDETQKGPYTLQIDGPAGLSDE